MTTLSSVAGAIQEAPLWDHAFLNPNTSRYADTSFALCERHRAVPWPDRGRRDQHAGRPHGRALGSAGDAGRGPGQGGRAVAVRRVAPAAGGLQGTARGTGG